MDTFNNIFDIAIILGGGYLIYAAQQMKVNDIIKVGIIVPPTVNVHSIKDREGFKKYAYPRHLMQGLILALLGLIGISCDLYGRKDLHVIIYALVLIFWIGFNAIVEKGKKKYFGNTDMKK